MNRDNVIQDNHYKEMLERSLLLPTNNQRLCSQLRNIAEGKMKVLLLGGSITAGYSPLDNITHPYPKLVETFMKEYFTLSQSDYINLGYASLHSLFGLAQIEARKSNQQTLKANTGVPCDTSKENINIIFIEYAINNGFDMEYAKSFEGLIRKLLLYYPNSAIVPICARNKVGYTCEPYIAKIAEYYSLPVVSITNALTYGQNHGLTWEDYSLDLVHPSPFGHKLIADCIICLIKASIKQESENKTEIEPNLDFNLVLGDKISIPSIYGDEFTGARYFDTDQIPVENRGEFISSPTHKLFPKGLICNKTSVLPLTLDLLCEKLYIIYEQSADAEISGKVSVDIRTQPQFTIIDSFSIYAWGNPAMMRLIDGPRQTYSIQIKMLPAQKKTRFQILGFLYV